MSSWTLDFWLAEAPVPNMRYSQMDFLLGFNCPKVTRSNEGLRALPLQTSKVERTNERTSGRKVRMLEVTSFLIQILPMALVKALVKSLVTHGQERWLGFARLRLLTSMTSFKIIYLVLWIAPQAHVQVLNSCFPLANKNAKVLLMIPNTFCFTRMFAPVKMFQQLVPKPDIKFGCQTRHGCWHVEVDADVWIGCVFRYS